MSGSQEARRTPDQIAAHRDSISVLMWQLSQVEIAEQLKISVATVNRDIKEIRKQQETLQNGKVEAVRGQLALELAAVRRTAWREYEASKKERKKSKVKVDATKVDEAGGALKTAETTREERNGDPRYLKIVADTIETEAKLLGANAPVKIAPTNPEGDKPYEPMGLEAFAALIEQVRQFEEERHVGDKPQA